MFDRSACARVHLRAEPHTDLSAPAALAALLQDVLSKRSAASDACDSGVSPLSSDRNRGKHHAKPEQTEVNTSPRGALRYSASCLIKMVASGPPPEEFKAAKSG